MRQPLANDARKPKLKPGNLKLLQLSFTLKLTRLTEKLAVWLGKHLSKSVHLATFLHLTLVILPHFAPQLFRPLSIQSHLQHSLNQWIPMIPSRNNPQSPRENRPQFHKTELLVKPLITPRQRRIQIVIQEMEMTLATMVTHLTIHPIRISVEIQTLQEMTLITTMTILLTMLLHLVLQAHLMEMTQGMTAPRTNPAQIAMMLAFQETIFMRSFAASLDLAVTQRSRLETLTSLMGLIPRNFAISFTLAISCFAPTQAIERTSTKSFSQSRTLPVRPLSYLSPTSTAKSTMYTAI
jgi:hypothetical protein